MRKDLVVYKANVVTEASYKLTLNELRVIITCIAKINPEEELTSEQSFEITASEFASGFSLSERAAYDALVDAAETLFKRELVIVRPIEDKNADLLRTRWLSSITYYHNSGKLSLQFGSKITPYLSNLKNVFTKYRLENISKMSSIYAIRLYELLAQWQTVGKREIEITWLRKIFELENSYPMMKDFKKRVIEPAVKDINEFSNLNIEWTQRKTGREVTSLIFTFSEKGEKKKKEVKKEKMIHGVRESEIVKHARPGESYEQAAKRIKELK